MKNKLALALIVLLGIFFRFINLNWDANQHLHPDERFLTMVAQKLEWPQNLFKYLDTSSSPLNPHNQGFDFFVYGTFPILVVKVAATLLGQIDYNQITLIGRFISASLDSSVVVLVFLISRKISLSTRSAILSALFYSISVLPLQLAHYFAVDSFLIFFLSLSFYFLVLFVSRPRFPSLILMSLSLGLAISSKISAALFLPVFIFALPLVFRKSVPVSRLILFAISFSLGIYLTVRLAQPYLFPGPEIFTLHLNSRVLSNWQELNSYNQPNFFYPPSTMWVHARKLIYPLENLAFWGLGIPAFIIAILSLVFAIRNFRKYPLLAVLAFWIILFFLYQGSQFSMPLRYFYPLFPFIAVASGIFISTIISRRSFLFFFVFLVLLIWPLSFISIYTHPHSRVVASQWIYQNLPSGSVLTCDYWDDCLPLSFTNSFSSQYVYEQLHLYDPDSPDKLLQLATQLENSDYLVITSNRLYGSIMTAPEHWPQTTAFYQALFSGSLGFTKIAEFSSRPNLNIPGINLCITPPFINYGKVAHLSQQCPLPGISIVDDYADETFTVYDHPKVLIFAKTDFSKQFLVQSN